MRVDILHHAVVYALRNICITCVRGTGLRQCVQFKTVTAVNLVVYTELESRVEEMVCVAGETAAVFQHTFRFCGFDCLIGGIAVVFPCVCTGALFRHFGQIPSTSVEHVGRTLHRAVVKRQRIVEVHLVETPFVLEPCLEVAHVDAVVISEPSAVVPDDVVIAGADIVHADQLDVLLRETAVGGKLLDITVCKRVDVNPLVGT